MWVSDPVKGVLPPRSLQPPVHQNANDIEAGNTNAGSQSLRKKIVIRCENDARMLSSSLSWSILQTTPSVPNPSDLHTDRSVCKRVTQYTNPSPTGPAPMRMKGSQSLENTNSREFARQSDVILKTPLLNRERNRSRLREGARRCRDDHGIGPGRSARGGCARATTATRGLQPQKCHERQEQQAAENTAFSTNSLAEAKANKRKPCNRQSQSVKLPDRRPRINRRCRSRGRADRERHRRGTRSRKRDWRGRKCARGSRSSSRQARRA